MKILSAEYVLPISADPIENGAVYFENGQIVAVGGYDEITKNYPGVGIEHFDEAVILPGFVNAHAHLEITAMRGFLDDVEEDFYSWLIKLTKTRADILNETDIEISALAGAAEAARAGVTCLADIGRYGKAGFEALKKTGLRGISFQETEFSPDDRTADEDFIKLREKFLSLRETETNLVKAGISPHAPYTVSARLFEKITEYALAENLKLTIHAAESAEEDELMKNGTGFFASVYQKFGFSWHHPNCSPIEYLAKLGVLQTKPLLAHCVTVSDEDIEILAATGTRVAHCPKSNAKFGHGAAPLEKFLDQMIGVGFGSDSVASNNSCDILEEARFATLSARNRPGRKRFLKAREIIEAATFGGALALGLENETGTLEAGKLADLTVVSLDKIAQQPVHDIYTALLFASNARDVRLTVAGGREIYRDGRMQTVDEEEIKAKLMEIRAKMNEGKV